MNARGQVANLREGDVVEATHKAWPKGSLIRGALYRINEGDSLNLCGYMISDGSAGPYRPELWTSFTVISRAPRPLYTNSDRTEPVGGDIARDRDGDVFLRSGSNWYMAGSTLARKGLGDFAPLTLLWDGETGQVVQ